MQITKSLIDKASAVCGSDAKLATRLGVSGALVSKWRNGSSTPNPVSIGKMAELTGTPLDQALLAPQLDALQASDEGRALIEKWRRGFLAGVVAITSIFGTDATAATVKVHQPVVNALYIVLSRLYRFRVRFPRLTRSAKAF
jgi:transcriptional regulator with XRE-family HTH domain